MIYFDLYIPITAIKSLALNDDSYLDTCKELMYDGITPLSSTYNRRQHTLKR